MKIKALGEFRHDADAEENGKWGTIAEGVEMKIRRLRSKVVTQARERIYGPYERAMGQKKKDLPEALEIQCTVQMLAEAVVVDWRGPNMVDEESGQPVPFTSENAKAIFSNEEYGKDLRAAVISLAVDGDFFSPDNPDVVADAGNLQTV